MTTYNISLNKELALIVDRELEQGKFANRSEFFRHLLREKFLFNNNQDWIYDKPYRGELEKRVKNLKNGKEEVVSSKEFDKEFGF